MTANVVDIRTVHRLGLEAKADAEPDPVCAMEQRLLGTLLSRPALLAEMPQGFGARHFLYPDHGCIYEAIQAAAATGQVYITSLVRAALPHLEGADDTGRATSYVPSLIQAMVGTLDGMAAPYARAVMDSSDRRDLLAVVDALRKEAAPAAAEPRPVAAVVAKAMVELERIAARQAVGKSAVSLDDAIEDAIEAGRLAHLRGSKLAGISTGFRCVDTRLSGMEPGCLYVLAARPGMGKTAMAIKMALKTARNEGPVLFLSLEMHARQLARRALALASGVPNEALKSGEYERDPEVSAALVKGQQALKSLPLSIVDQPGLKLAEIRLKIKAAMAEHGELALVILDHMHIAGREEASAKHGDTFAIAEISRGLKAIAKDFGIPVLALAQLNRGVEGRDDKRPNLSDLRQSGGIEEDADAVMMLYRAEYYARRAPTERRIGETDEKYYERSLSNRAFLESVTGKAELLFEKVRDGECGTEDLRFDGKRLRFYEEGERA